VTGYCAKSVRDLPGTAGAASGPDLRRWIWPGGAASANHCPLSPPHTPKHKCLPGIYTCSTLCRWHPLQCSTGQQHRAADRRLHERRTKMMQAECSKVWWNQRHIDVLITTCVYEHVFPQNGPHACIDICTMSSRIITLNSTAALQDSSEVIVTSSASSLVLTSWHRLRNTSFLTPSLKLLSRATPSSPMRTGKTTAALLRLCLSCILIGRQQSHQHASCCRIYTNWRGACPVLLQSAISGMQIRVAANGCLS